MRAHEGRRDSLTSPLRETKTDTRELLEGPKKNNILPDEGQLINLPFKLKEDSKSILLQNVSKMNST